MPKGIEELYGQSIGCDDDGGDDGGDTGSGPCDTPTDDGCVSSDGGAY